MCDISHLSEAVILEGIGHFVGEIDQYPPVFSAIKVDGKRAYKSARKGQEVEVPSRRVLIESFKLLGYEALARVRIRCGKGTYIRSLAHDLGQQLGTGGYLTALKAHGHRRLSSGRCLAGGGLWLAE
ncbi:MAG: hypothetical protein R3B47_11180 [Bacteroidia bacterium]